jgi:hypothetical protein
MKQERKNNRNILTIVELAAIPAGNQVHSRAAHARYPLNLQAEYGHIPTLSSFIYLFMNLASIGHGSYIYLSSIFHLSFIYS